jgi:hypothetical protein
VIVVLAACGGGDDDSDDGGGTQSIEASVRRNSERVIAAEKTECTFDGDRQVIARGIVHNSGEQPYSVQISVRSAAKSAPKPTNRVGALDAAYAT